MTARLLQPKGWAAPRGYANGVSASGRLVFVSGMIGWDAAARLVPGDLVAQARQALANIVAVLAEDGARPEHLVRLTWFVTDRAAYLAAAEPLGAAYREVIGRHYPAMSVLEGKTIKGCAYGSAQVRRDFPRFITLIEQGKLDVGSMVSRTVHLHEVNDAIRAMQDGEVIRSVIV